jgi:hypothetical protein
LSFKKIGTVAHEGSGTLDIEVKTKGGRSQNRDGALEEGEGLHMSLEVLVGYKEDDKT